MSISLRNIRVWIYSYSDDGTAGRPKAKYTRQNSDSRDKAWWASALAMTGREYTIGGAKHSIDALFGLDAAAPVNKNSILRTETGELYRVLAVLPRLHTSLQEQEIMAVIADGAVAANLLDA